MLAMARGLATDPALLLLDELSMGLAPIIVEELYEIVAQVAREGVSILVVEQFASTVLGRGRLRSHSSCTAGSPRRAAARAARTNCRRPIWAHRDRGDGKIESHERVEQFKQEIADMKVRDPATGRDRVWLRVGIALMVVGVGVVIVAYFMSHGTSNPLAQNDALVLALIGLHRRRSSAARCSCATRSPRSCGSGWPGSIYEQQAQTDRIVDAPGS